MYLTCACINLKKSKVASVELNRRLEEVVFITEPYTVGNVKLLDFANGSVFSSMGNDPRAAMRITNKLQPWLVDEFTGKDICTVVVKIDGKLTYLSSVYLDINFDVDPPILLRLIDKCKEKGFPLVISMDSNAHSPMWGCEEENLRGKDLGDLINSKSLMVLNEGTEPTFKTIRAESIIDITLINAPAIQNLSITEWRVDTSPSFSDHRYIKFKVGGYVPEEESYRNLKKADWNLFRNILTESSEGNNMQGMDARAEEIEKSVSQALELACPKKKAIRRKPNRWWTPGLEVLREEVKDLSKISHRSQENWDCFQSHMRTYKYEVRRAKRLSWQDFCTRAESAKELADVMKKLKPKSKIGVSLMKTNGETAAPADTLVELMDTHFPDSVTTNDEGEGEGAPDALVEHGPHKEEVSKVVDFITVNKVRAAFNSFGAKKAAGPDGMNPLVLQNLDEGTYNNITELYKRAIITGHTPRAWRQMKVVFLPKEGKDDYGKAKAYRPITLSNFILKGLERIVQWYTKEYLVKKAPICSTRIHNGEID